MEDHHSLRQRTVIYCHWVQIFKRSTYFDGFSRFPAMDLSEAHFVLKNYALKSSLGYFSSLPHSWFSFPHWFLSKVMQKSHFHSPWLRVVLGHWTPFFMIWRTLMNIVVLSWASWFGLSCTWPLGSLLNGLEDFDEHCCLELCKLVRFWSSWPMKTHVLKGDCLIRVLGQSILKARLPECAGGKTEQGLKWEVLELITVTSSYHHSSWVSQLFQVVTSCIMHRLKCSWFHSS